jgi:hypothetical protein
MVHSEKAARAAPLRFTCEHPSASVLRPPRGGEVLARPGIPRCLAWPHEATLAVSSSRSAPSGCAARPTWRVRPLPTYDQPPGPLPDLPERGHIRRWWEPTEPRGGVIGYLAGRRLLVAVWVGRERVSAAPATRTLDQAERAFHTDGAPWSAHADRGLAFAGGGLPGPTPSDQSDLRAATAPAVSTVRPTQSRNSSGP